MPRILSIIGVQGLSFAGLLWGQRPPGHTISVHGGYARSFQIDNIDGGASVAFDAMFGRHIRFGITGGYYNLGSSNTDTTTRILLPSPQTARIISESARSGWNIGVGMMIPLGALSGRTAFIGSLTYQRFTTKERVELRDSTGALIQPPIGGSTTSGGWGGMAGVSVKLFRVSPHIDAGLDGRSTFLLLRSASGESAFLQYFDVGMQLQYTF